MRVRMMIYLEPFRMLQLSDLFWLKVSIFHRLLHSQLLPSYRHAAGIIDFVDLKSQTAERMGKVFKPKAGRDVFVKGGIRTEIKIIIWDHGFWWILFWYLEEWFFSTTRRFTYLETLHLTRNQQKSGPLLGAQKRKAPPVTFITAATKADRWQVHGICTKLPRTQGSKVLEIIGNEQNILYFFTLDTAYHILLMYFLLQEIH